MQAAMRTPPLVFHSRAPSADAVELSGREYHQLDKQLTELFFKLSIHDQWSKCRLQNARAYENSNKHVLRPLLTTANRTPHLFPPTLADLRCLDLASVLVLLQAYEQQVPVNIELEAARRVFARFIGAPAY